MASEKKIAAYLIETICLCDPSKTSMERVTRTGLSMYHQSSAPAPPPDLQPVVAPASAEPVAAAGPPAVVPAVIRPHEVPTHHRDDMG